MACSLQQREADRENTLRNKTRSFLHTDRLPAASGQRDARSH